MIAHRNLAAYSVWTYSPDIFRLLDYGVCLTRMSRHRFGLFHLWTLASNTLKAGVKSRLVTARVDIKPGCHYVCSQNNSSAILHLFTVYGRPGRSQALGNKRKHTDYEGKQVRLQHSKNLMSPPHSKWKARQLSNLPLLS